MRFDDQLAAYLYEYKTLRLEGIGTFTLDSKVNVPLEQDKEVYYPIEGLSFVYNPKASTDEEIITYLVKKLHKIQPLIRSDLEFYLANIKQFINLGKPYTIEGIGTLSKDNYGVYEFTPGNFLPAKEELNPKRENAAHNYPVRSQNTAGKTFVYILLIIAGLAALGGIGWGISNFIANRKTSSDNEQVHAINDTNTQKSRDTSAGINTVNSNTLNTDFSAAERRGDSVNYKMVFEVTPNKTRAVTRTTTLNNYGTRSRYDSILINNTTYYRLFVPAKIRAADTLRTKKTLSKHLGKQVWIARN